MKKISFIIISVLLSLVAYAQDVRTLDTKVADILARMPAYNEDALAKQLQDFGKLAPDGWDMVCGQLVAPGTGDDTRARFLLESFSRYLSGKKENEEAASWEQHVIKYAKAATNIDLFRFWCHQMEIFGSGASADFAASFLTDREKGEAAVAVFAAVKPEGAEDILLNALKNKEINNAAAIMNTLASWNYNGPVEELVGWYASPDAGTKAAALNALATTGRKEAARVLAAAAREAGYAWDATGATAAYLKYADILAKNGNSRQMMKICSEVNKKADYKTGIQYKCQSLSIMAEHQGYMFIDDLIGLFSDENIEYRHHALKLAGDIDHDYAGNMLISSFGDIDDSYKPDVIRMLGKRGGDNIETLIRSGLLLNDSESRKASMEALVNLIGRDALKDFIPYLQKSENVDEIEHIFSLMQQIAGSEERAALADNYDSFPDLAKSFALLFLSQGGENRYFDMIIPETESKNELIRNSAYISLKNVAASKDIDALLGLLERTDEKQELNMVQQALANALNSIENEEARADDLLTAMQETGSKMKIIPVLAKAGGQKALATVLDEFYSGDDRLKELCFDALTAWKDYSASYALFEICRSGKDNYRKPAFEGFVRQVSTAPVPPEQRLLLMRKIMPYAETADQKMSVLNNIANVHTVPALIFADKYIADDELGQVAARAAMAIALPANNTEVGLYGDKVKEILEKVATIISGEESDYFRERVKSYIEEMPSDQGFVSMFNGKDLSGWQGLVENPVSRAGMSKQELAIKQDIANRKMLGNWSVKDGAIWFNGNGANLCSVKEYGDFEMLVDWRITKDGDSGIYLRGTPQVQIWDTSRVEVGAQVGSGGLYNNTVNERNPIVVADNPVGDWNTFRILMQGERVSVWLNGILVVDDVVMENYWDRNIPIFPRGPIELQAHGNELAFRDIYIREIEPADYKLTPEEKREGFVSLFNGQNLDNWINGDKGSYVVEDACIVVRPNEGSGGNLYTTEEYSDFNFRFEFKLTPDANNGLGIRTPTSGDAAYVGMELQILDNTAAIYEKLQPYQYHGSVYGVIPAKRGFLNPLGEWNSQEVIVEGTSIKVILNGEVILDGDIADARDNGTMDHNDHPGLKNEKGHIGFLGHGSVVSFRNIRIKDLSK